MTRKQPKRLYAFGTFRLDADERVLFGESGVVPLTPKAFDTLLALVENSGHVLGKEELMRRVWPDSFVEENNLAQNISVLRKALGEDGGGRRYIETVPRRGYRFVADVSGGPDAGAGREGGDRHPARRRARRSRDAARVRVAAAQPRARGRAPARLRARAPARDEVRPQRRRQHRLSGHRRRAARPRLRHGLGLAPGILLARAELRALPRAGSPPSRASSSSTSAGRGSPTACPSTGSRRSNSAWTTCAP